MPDVQGPRAMPNRTCGLEHPKDEHEKQRHSVRKREKKNAVASPLEVIFPLEMGLPEKNHNNFFFLVLLPHSVHITILFSQ